MRRLILPVLIVLAAACSSTPTTVIEPPPPPPPPPAPSGAPASVSVQGGDGQQGTPGAPLAVAPSVVVKNASGAPLSGIAVTFSVDSGGGAVAGGSAITNAIGVATLGSWTLGANPGRNVLRVTVAGLAPMFVTATATVPLVMLASNVTIGSGGGSVAYHKSGDPLDGLAITIPAAAFHVATQWTVTAKQGVAVPLPSDVFTVGPAIGITDGQAYADSVMTLRIPVQATSDIALTAFFYDSNSTTLEMVPIVSRDAASITVATRHFSADQLVTPATSFPSGSIFGAPAFGVNRSMAPAPATPWSIIGHALPSLRRGGPPPFGTIIVQVVGISRAALMLKTFYSSFVPGVDDWEFPDMVTSYSIGTINDGMVVSELYYNYRFKKIQGGLYHRYDRLANFAFDNPSGIRFASVLLANTAKYFVPPTLGGIPLYTVVPPAQTTYDQVVMSIYVTGRPQFINAQSADGLSARSELAYAASASTIIIDDTHTPGLVGDLVFDGTNFVPVGLSDLPGSPAWTASVFEVMGVSAIVPLATLDTYWAQLKAGTIGSPQFVDTYLEYYNYSTDTWDDIPITLDTLRIVSDTFLVRTNCSNCQHLRSGSPLATRQYTEVVDGIGASYANDRPDFVRGALVLMNPRSQTLGLTSFGYSNQANNPSLPPQWSFQYTNFRWLTVLSSGVSIGPRAATGPVDSGFVFTAHNPGNYPHGTKFNWTISINQTVFQFTNVDDSTQGASFTTPGAWKVKVDIRDPNNQPLGSDSTTVNITLYQVIIDPAFVVINQPPFEANPGDPVTFIANITSTAFRPAGLQYVWNFGDPGAQPVITTSPTVVHTYTATSSSVGSFTVTLDLYVGNIVVGHTSVSAQIKVWPPIWRFTSFVRTGFDTLPTGYRLQPPSQAVLDSIDLYMGKIVAIPSDGLILISDDSSYSEHSVVLTVARVAGTGTFINNWLFGDYFTLVARTCCQAGMVTDVGTTTSGTLDGWSSTTAFQGGEYNEVHAVKSSTTSNGIKTGTLTGTITIWSPGALSFQPFGRRMYTFTAVKISP